MAKLTSRQLDRAYCALEKRRDATRKQATSGKFSAATRMALARAVDAMTVALRHIQSEETS